MRNIFKGNLATVENEAVQNLISMIIPSWYVVWIGGYRVQNGWAWKDGATFNYTKWNIGEPNNGGGNENCIISTVTGWNDVRCTITKYFICQYEI